jgi:hypothetical protein
MIALVIIINSLISEFKHLHTNLIVYFRMSGDSLTPPLSPESTGFHIPDLLDPSPPKLSRPEGLSFFFLKLFLTLGKLLPCLSK